MPDRNVPLPGRRVILLGASNVTRGLSAALDVARRLWGAPLDVLGAFGHGRSYGLPRGALWHARPGIVECGLWRSLEERPPVPTAALVTDIGNDLLYEVPVPEIVGWVEACVDRLLRAGARVALTPLPLAGIGRITPSRFLVLRSVLFPWSRLQFGTVLGWARDLDERLRHLAAKRGLLLAEQRPAWYGFDPIHVRRRWLAAAWLDMMSRWVDVPPAPAARRGSLRQWLYLKRLAPERSWNFDRERLRPQPAGALADGTVLSLY